MIPTNASGNQFLSQDLNQNRAILTALLPIPVTVTYSATVATGNASRVRIISAGLAKARLRAPVTIPRKFACDLIINGVHDIAMVDRIE